MDVETFRKAGYEAIDKICDYFATMHEQPVVSQVQPGFLFNNLPSHAPERGEDFSVISSDFHKLVMPGITHWQHPSFFAWFPAANTFESIIGDLYSTSLSNPSIAWIGSPACTELEQVVMDWGANLFGLANHFLHSSRSGGGGVIQTTASGGLLAVCVAARSRYLRAHPDAKLEDLVIYVTSETQSMGIKTGLVLGLPVRALPVTKEDKFGLRGETLRRALEEDHARGKHPFVVVGTLGTTRSGAIDYVDEIGEVLKEHPLIWLHVDAAWAGSALSCPEFRELLRLEAVNQYADSFGVNLNKWGLVNFDCHALWVRNSKALTDALDITPEYLRTAHHDTGLVVDYRNWHITLGRRFRALKLWFVLRGYGVQGFQAYIRKGVEQTNYFASLVRASADFELVATPVLGLSVFRLKPQSSQVDSDNLATANDLNRALGTRLGTENDKILLTPTILDGVACLRMATGGQFTENKHIDAAWELIQACGREVVALWTDARGQLTIEADPETL